MDFGYLLYTQRKKKKYSQKRLAELVGVSRQTVSKWETNSVSPTKENITIICKVLKVNENYFLETDDPTAPSLNKPLQSPVPFTDVAETPLDLDETAVAIAPNPPVENVTAQMPKAGKGKRLFGLLFGLCADILLFLCSLFFTVCLGFITITENVGYEVVYSNPVDIRLFYISLIFTVLFSALVVLLSVLIARKFRQDKKCKLICKPM